MQPIRVERQEPVFQLKAVSDQGILQAKEAVRAQAEAAAVVQSQVAKEEAHEAREGPREGAGVAARRPREEVEAEADQRREYPQ